MFAVRCLRRIFDISEWEELKLKDSRAIKRALEALLEYAQGQDRDPRVYRSVLPSVLAQAESAKATAPPVDTSNRYAANTAHYFYDVLLGTIEAVDQALQFDAYQTMEGCLRVARAQAIYNCDGDPVGAVRMAIDDSRAEAIAVLERDYELLKSFASGQNDDVAVPLSIFEAPAPQRTTATSTSPLFQVFLSFKNLDGRGLPTEDRSLAATVATRLCAQGVSVFFSPETLRDRGTSAFKRAIEDALDQCQILVAIGTSAENLDSEWVRWEWDGFSQDILSRIKPDGRIFSYVKGVSISQLPRTLRQNQVFFHERDELTELCLFIERAMANSEASRITPVAPADA